MNRSDLSNKLKNFIEEDYVIENIENHKDNCVTYLLKRDGELFELTTYIKNITSAYLPYDENVERIIIPVLPKIKKTEKNSAFLLVGYKNINGIDVLIFWNPMRYTNHKTNRSVYIYPQNCERSAEKGFFTTIDHKNKIYGCTNGNFGKVLKQYIEDTYMEVEEW